MDADDIKNLGKTKDSLRELFEDRLDAFDVEKRITEEHKKQGTNLQKLSGIYQNVHRNFYDNLEKQFKLKKDIKNLEKEIYDTTQKLEATAGPAAKASIKLSLDGFKQRKSNLEKEYLDVLKLNKATAGPWLYLITQTINLFKTLDKAAFDFRQTIGYTREDSLKLKNVIQDMSIQMMHIGVNAEILNKSFLAASNVAGGLNNVTAQVAGTLAILNAQLGTSVEDSAKMLQTFAVLSGTTMEMQTNMVYFTQALSAAAGVSFNQIASDFKSMGDTTLTMVSRLPLAMAKTAVELRRMGTDINTSAAASAKLLDFTQNIQDEMAASVLLGHSINLQKARELAYHRNIEGSTKEILRIAKQNNFAHGMDTFQMQAFAQATGRSVEDLLNMVQASEQFDASLRSTDPIVRSMAENYQKLHAANQATAEATGKDVAYQLLLKSNQERLVAITQKWGQIIAKISGPFLTVIDGILSVIPMLMNFAPYMAPLILIFRKGYEYIGGMAGLMRKFALAIEGIKNDKIFSIFAAIYRSVGKIGEFLSKFSLIGKIGLFFAKWLEPIGWVITAGQFLYSLFENFSKIEFVKGDWIGNIWKGIKAVAGAIYDVLLSPFVEAWDWLKKTFLGNSPSELGLSIVKGLESVGAMIFDTLTMPFRTAFSWILSKIPGMGKFAAGIKGGLSGALEHKVSATYVPAVTVTPNGTKIINGKSDKDVATAAPEKEAKYSLDDLFDQLKQLNDNLMSGKVKAGDVYLDTSLVSSVLARGIEFKGGYGGNR